MTDETIDPREEEIQAWDRIARSHDGHLIHRHLRRVLEAVYDTPTDGALMSHNGRRSLARDLMRHMAKGIEESSGRISNPADRPVLVRDSRPVGPRRARGAGRRVTADTIVPGWNVAGDGVDEPTGKT